LSRLWPVSGWEIGILAYSIRFNLI